MITEQEQLFELNQLVISAPVKLLVFLHWTCKTFAATNQNAKT